MPETKRISSFGTQLFLKFPSVFTEISLVVSGLIITIVVFNANVYKKYCLALYLGKVCHVWEQKIDKTSQFNFFTDNLGFCRGVVSVKIFVNIGNDWLFRYMIFLNSIFRDQKISFTNILFLDTRSLLIWRSFDICGKVLLTNISRFKNRHVLCSHRIFH